jgi:hypothetical protein
MFHYVIMLKFFKVYIILNKSFKSAYNLFFYLFD